ncbi:MAG TPA: hypothetical protein VM490_12070 [Armatimonadaceae bacterium]|nr:hypothetical protein [Armatimonadaceae bacterium]
MMRNLAPDTDIRVEFQTGVPMSDGLRAFAPGETVAGTLTIRTAKEVKCNHAYLRLAWHTEGRGDRDRAVVQERDVFQGTLRAGEPTTFPFEFLAPRDPWSYAGVYVNIVWAVEVDLDVPWAVNPRHEQPFVLAAWSAAQR